MILACDGGSRNNQQAAQGLSKAAYAVVKEVRDGVAVVRSGKLKPGTTNNEAELTALYFALRAVANSGDADNTIYTDSAYLITVIQNMYDWQRNGWNLKSGKPAKNVNIIIHIMASLEDIKSRDKAVNIKRVNGHSNESRECRIQDVADKELNRIMNGGI